MKKAILVILVASNIIGCTTFSEQAIIKAAPRDIQERNNYLPTAQWNYETTELAGSILV